MIRKKRNLTVARARKRPEVRERVLSAVTRRTTPDIAWWTHLLAASEPQDIDFDETNLARAIRHFANMGKLEVMKGLLDAIANSLDGSDPLNRLEIKQTRRGPPSGWEKDKEQANLRLMVSCSVFEDDKARGSRKWSIGNAMEKFNLTAPTIRNLIRQEAYFRFVEASRFRRELEDWEDDDENEFEKWFSSFLRDDEVGPQ